MRREGTKFTAARHRACIIQHCIADHVHHSYHRTCQYLSSLHLPCLPLGLLLRQECVQDSNKLLQRGEPLLELSLYLAFVVAQLSVEVLAVGCGAHGSTEYGLDHEGVVGLECVAVGIAEGVGELLGGVGDVVAEGLGSEVEATGTD